MEMSGTLVIAPVASVSIDTCLSCQSYAILLDLRGMRSIDRSHRARVAVPGVDGTNICTSKRRTANSTLALVPTYGN